MPSRYSCKMLVTSFIERETISFIVQTGALLTVKEAADNLLRQPA